MKISFRDGNIHYSDNGSGSVIVLIHGYLETMDVWEHFAKNVAQKYRVVTIDLPGHGYSDCTCETNTMEIFALAIKEVLDYLKIKKAFLAGHSMGGYATLAFLQLYPGYLSGYSLIHSHPFADPPEVKEKREKNISLIEAGRKNDMIPDFIRGLYAEKNIEEFKESVERSVRIASSIDEKTIIADLKGMMARHSGVHLIEEGKIPFLWILGTMDSHINFVAIQKNVSLPANSRVVILSNSGHMGFIEEEDLSVKYLTEFADSLSI
ncbi:MAG: alpha/beta hydrolase [Bacteroidetes bacterium]|nr:alpha/beta hydrolase [Bacteroidota bacterium]